MNVLDELVQDQLRTDLPELASGDTVKVSAKVVEGNRERIQVFEGTVMRLRGGGITRSITVRRIATRRRRRADLQGQQPAHREDRGRPPRPSPAAPSCTSCASASARPRRSASGAPTLTSGGPPAAPPTSDPADPAGSLDSGYASGRWRPIVPTLRHERRLWNAGLERVVGVDEVGVAPTCGAVVAAAVIMRPGCHRIPGRPRLQDAVRRPSASGSPR